MKIIKQLLVKRNKRIALKEDLALAIKSVLLAHEVEMKRGTDRGIRRTARKITRQCILRADEATRLKIAESVLKVAEAAVE